MALVATTGVGNTCRSEDRRYEGDDKMKERKTKGERTPDAPSPYSARPAPAG